MIRFAILLCTHNGEAHLPQQLASLASQRLCPVVIFVHDWNSSDATRTLVAEFAASQRGRLRVELVCHPAAPGACASFVTGIEAALESHIEFTHLAFCDQDDVWSPDKLATFAARIGSAAEPPALVYSDVRIVDAAGRQLCGTHYGADSVFLPPEQLRDPGLILVNPVIGMTMVASRPFLAECRSRLRGPWMMHDWALALLAVTGGRPTLYVAQALVDYRQHGFNALGAARGLRLRQRVRKAAEQFRRIRRQAEWLGENGARALGEAAAGVARDSATQRIHAARAAIASRLIKWPSRLLLSCAILIFW